MLYVYVGTSLIIMKNNSRFLSFGLIVHLLEFFFVTVILVYRF